MNRWYKDIFIFLGFLLLPFVVLNRYAPYLSSSIIGNDYRAYSFLNQLKLFYIISTGSFPMYVPGYWGGQSAAALTLGQIFHPLAWLNYLAPGFWDGYALLNVTVIRFFSLGITHFLLFVTLTRLLVPSWWAFVCSFVTIYNMRMLDLFRYGAALEGFTGHILTIVCLSFRWLYPYQKKFLIFLILVVYLSICSGHPQTAYYGLLASGMVMLLIPFVFCFLEGEGEFNAIEKRSQLFKYYFSNGGCILVGLLLSASYTLPFYCDFLKTNFGRIDNQFEWSDDYKDSVLGSLNSFIFPFFGDVHGNFGGSVLPFAALSTILLPLALPSIFYILIVLIVFWFLAVLGGFTPIYYWLWQILPFSNALRISGRLSIFIPVLVLLLLIIVEKFIRPTPLNRSKFSFILFCLSLFLLGGTVYEIISPQFSIYSPMAINNVSNWKIVIAQLSGILTLIFLANYFRNPKLEYCKLLVMIFVMIQTTLTLGSGTWSNSDLMSSTKVELTNRYKNTLYPFGDPYVENMMGNKDVYEQKKFVKQNISDNIEKNEYLNPKLAKLLIDPIIIDPQNTVSEIFIEGLKNKTQIGYQAIIESTQKPSLTSQKFSGEVSLLYSNYNRIKFRVNSNVPSYFVTSYPLNSHWSAKIGGESVNLLRADALYISLKVPAGGSEVEFRYWSWAQFWGVVISCLTLLGMGVWISVSSRRYNSAGIIISILLPSMIFYIWYMSLYSGESLGTEYHWQTE